MLKFIYAKHFRVQAALWFHWDKNMKRMFVDTQNGQIHCLTEGKGRPVLLLHQVPMSSATFSEVIPILSQRFWVLAMDFPLYGDSYKPLNQPSIADFAKAVLSFLNALGIRCAHIAGHHTGACVAVELAVEYPDFVDKLVLSGCPSWTSEEGLRWLASSRYRPLVITPDGWFMDHIWKYTMQRIPPNKLTKAYESAIDYLKSGVRAEEGHRAAFSYPTVTKLSKISKSTLVLCGDKDILFPYHENTLKYLTHCSSCVIQGAPSQTPRLYPVEWGKAVLEFLLQQ